MEDTEEFKSWLFKLLLDSKRVLGMSDKTIAFILVNIGMDYFNKAFIEYGIRDTKEHN